MWARSRSAAVRFVDVDGVRLRVAVRGRGRPLLLLMGIGANLEMWGPCEERLSAASRTIVFDAPGTGRRPRRRRH